MIERSVAATSVAANYLTRIAIPISTPRILVLWTFYIFEVGLFAGGRYSLSGPEAQP